MRTIDRLINYSTKPLPLRVLAMRKLLQRLPLGSYTARLQANAVDRPWYGRCLYNAAVEAKALKVYPYPVKRSKYVVTTIKVI